MEVGVYSTMALIHLCELDTRKLFLGTHFDGSSHHRMAGRRAGETEM